MHELTKAGDYGLELMLEKDDGSVKTLNWDSFKVAGENDKFRMTINGFKAGRSGLSNYFQNHNGQRFSTQDQENDTYGSHDCANQPGGHSGWWYKNYLL